ncbi:MAG: hypothetical protein AAF502_11070 [Bacteroidota bacterium]
MNFLQVKTKANSVAFILSIMVCFSVTLNAQFSFDDFLKYSIFDVTATQTVGEWKSVPEVGLQFIPLNFLAIYAGYQPLSDPFQVEGSEYKGKSFNASMRLFPFGGPHELHVFKGNRIRSPRRYYPKQSGFNSRRKNPCHRSSNPLAFFKGVYVSAGYTYADHSIKVTSDFNNESLLYQIEQQGLVVDIGYLIRFENLSLGFSYGWSFDRPVIDGPGISSEYVFPDAALGVLTGNRGLRITAGFNF